MTQLYVSPITQMIAHQGVSARMAADVERALPEFLVPAALAKGVKPAGEVATNETETPDRVPDVVQAIFAMMAGGDEKAFSKTTGEPNLTALRKQAGFAVTDPERDAAWAIVKAEG